MDRRMPPVPVIEGVGLMSVRGSESGPKGTELLGLGIFIAGAFVLPLVAGLAIDGLVHTSPLFLFLGVILGIVAAGAGLYSRLRRYW
jgi:hypothetical protein